MQLEDTFGSASEAIHRINLKLAALGCSTVQSGSEQDFQELARAILRRGENAGPKSGFCAADRRIMDFLQRYLGAPPPPLPHPTFELDAPGLARAVSLPWRGDDFASPILNSYRVRQGVLHNPKSDRRTTQGIFHIAEGGLPIPDDKMAVPKAVFGRMLEAALRPPQSLLRLPFTAAESTPAECYVTLLLRPIVCPSVPGFTKEKRMEIRFFAPGSLVSNLDFVESIFGNGGDPHLPQNDAGLDVEHWTGHTGCVILAPHLIELTKRELGLPNHADATERQRRDGMCWQKPDEKYNGGGAFKLTARDASGTMVTIIADNYFGYCKKEVKTQISFAANLLGLCEEEHAGGALVYPSYDLGEEFSGDLHLRPLGHSFAEVLRLYRPFLALQPEGHAVDRHHHDIVYVPEDCHFDIRTGLVSWEGESGPRSIRLLAGRTYVRPSGYKVHIEKIPGTKSWRLVGTVGEGLLCHKPCTVSGGGKSEISKAITDAIIQGSVFVADLQRDFDQVAALIDRDYSDRFREALRSNPDSRPVLSRERSLGSVIKLLTPSEAEYTPSYNAWLNTIPQHVKELVFVVKRFYKPEWEGDWRRHFSVDTINGVPGNELKFENRKLVTSYLRIGFERDGAWRVFGLRKDFHPAAKISMEDDITASVVAPGQDASRKFVVNCENRLFQRPDDAIHRGYDLQTEIDFSQSGNFFSNYEPLTRAQAQELIEDAMGFEQFSEPMRQTLRHAAHDAHHKYVVSSAHPRLVEGKPSKNPRYLQWRPDLARPREKYLADVATRLHRRLPVAESVITPVGALVPGRRNNPPDLASKIRPLAIYNPIHYMELPELFMEYICSMTGKSPSTTGAGSEGALTKGPFNALPPIYDLNNAFVANVLCRHHGFVTAAGFVGPHARMDHDISLLVPEIWSRMSPSERDPAHMIAHGYLERCPDLEHAGHPVLSSRLGWRITRQFVVIYFGRVFNHPHAVLTSEMLRPELQDLAVFADGMDNIVATQKRVAAHYFADGSVAAACPPLQALLHIMTHGTFEGRGLGDPGLRAMFTREAVLSSEWYRQRLLRKQEVDRKLWERHSAYLAEFVARGSEVDEEALVAAEDRLSMAKAELARVSAPVYLEALKGTIGAQPL